MNYKEYLKSINNSKKKVIKDEDDILKKVIDYIQNDFRYCKECYDEIFKIIDVYFKDNKEVIKIEAITKAPNLDEEQDYFDDDFSKSNYLYGYCDDLADNLAYKLYEKFNLNTSYKM